jgi:transposase
MDHTGIDLHKKESQICILGAEGELIEQRVRTTPASFADVLGNRPRARILLEASTESEWVARCLEGWGTRSSSLTPTSRPCTPPAVARSRRIAAMPERWPRPVGSGPTVPPIGSPMPSAMCAGA